MDVTPLVIVVACASLFFAGIAGYRDGRAA